MNMLGKCSDKTNRKVGYKNLFMKKLIIVLLYFVSITAKADYPIFWQRYTADPWCIEHDGRLYMFCSHDVYDSQQGYKYIMKDITCISTDDLKNWTDHGEVFSIADAAWKPQLTWAPCVVERDHKFYLYYGNGDKGIGVAISDSPTGPYKDISTKPMVDSNTPGVLSGRKTANGVRGALKGSENWGFWCFDPAVFVDDDGQAYMYFGGANPANSRIIRLKLNMVEVEGKAIHPDTPGFFEASAMHKYKGKYYYSYSGHWFNNPSNIDYVMSDSPMGGFGEVHTAMVNPPVNEHNNHHHCIFEYQGQWYMAYHNRQVAYENGISDPNVRIYQRSVALDRLYYNADGTIQPVEATRDGLPQIRWVNPYQRNEAETMAKGWGISTKQIDGKNRAAVFSHDDNYIRIRGVDLSQGINMFKAVAKGCGKIDVRLEGQNGVLLCTLPVNATNWKEISMPAISANGIFDIFLVFHGAADEEVKLDYWTFQSKQS